MIKKLLRPSGFKLALLWVVVFALIRWSDQASAAGRLPVLNTFEHALGDLRFHERLTFAAPDPPTTTVLVAEDEKTIHRAGRWPWPRALYAKLVDRLAKAGAKAIVFDVAFVDSYGPMPTTIRPSRIRFGVRAGPSRPSFSRASRARAGIDEGARGAFGAHRQGGRSASPRRRMSRIRNGSFRSPSRPTSLRSWVSRHRSRSLPRPPPGSARSTPSRIPTARVRFIPPVSRVGSKLYLPSISSGRGRDGLRRRLASPGSPAGKRPRVRQARPHRPSTAQTRRSRFRWPRVAKCSSTSRCPG